MGTDITLPSSGELRIDNSRTGRPIHPWLRHSSFSSLLVLSKVSQILVCRENSESNRENPENLLVEAVALGFYVMLFGVYASCLFS